MNIHRDESGFTLAEVLLAAGLLAIGIAASESYFVHQAQVSVVLRGYSSRDKILSTIRTAAGMAAAIRNSYLASGVNTALQNCLTTQPSFLVANPAYQDCNSGSVNPFTLYGPLSVTAGGVSYASGAITGVPTSPVYYDLFGEVCTPSSSPSNSCLIQAWSVFIPQCPPATLLGPPAPSCDVAELITVQYHIEPIPGVSSPNQKFIPVTGQFTLSAMQISGNPLRSTRFFLCQVLCPCRARLPVRQVPRVLRVLQILQVLRVRLRHLFPRLLTVPLRQRR